MAQTMTVKITLLHYYIKMWVVEMVIIYIINNNIMEKNPSCTDV